MFIAGLDCSPTSTGIVRFELDENFEIIDMRKLGFIAYSSIDDKGKQKKKVNIPNYKDIISYDKSKYDFYQRTLMMHSHIFPFISACEYACFENYSFGSVMKGNITEIAEFCSTLKFFLLNQGTKIRLISPTQNKQFLFGKGNAEKPNMLESFLENTTLNKLYISDLPKIPIHTRGKFAGLPNRSGISPTSDIVDASALVLVLYTELLIKKGIKQLDELIPIHKHVLTHTTKTTPEPLYKSEFIQRI
jgi:hypothetical protein